MRKTDNPALINQLTYLSPFMSLFLISIVLGEKIVPTTMIGLALIVFGIVFNEYFVKSKASK
jgi:drug/metabolite transporter (DMT)-like permease